MMRRHRWAARSSARRRVCRRAGGVACTENSIARAACRARTTYRTHPRHRRCAARGRGRGRRCGRWRSSPRQRGSLVAVVQRRLKWRGVLVRSVLVVQRGVRACVRAFTCEEKARPISVVATRANASRRQPRSARGCRTHWLRCHVKWFVDVYSEMGRPFIMRVVDSKSK